MNEGYYITSDNKSHPIKPKKILCLINMDIVKLVVPYGVEDVFCYDNKLSELILPESVIKVDCENNQLKELQLPDSVRFVWCDNINIPDLDRFINKDININL